jgi:glycine betaine/proline transport system ATP-binding protein
MTQIALDRVTVIFGPRPDAVWPLLADGLEKSEILDRTGHHVALSTVSLTVPEGGILAVMGPSGSGKSTLLRVANMLVRPTRGEVTVDGRPLSVMTDSMLREFRRATMGMVFQSFGLLPHLTVLDNVAFPLALAGLSRRDRQDRARHWLARIGLSADEGSYPSQISSGMQQRVGLARALIAEPPVLLMDEPFAALDPITRRDMQDQVLSLQSELRKTVILVTHDPAEALRMADQVALLRAGRLVQVGSYRDVTLHPADDGVAAFVRGFGPARGLPAARGDRTVAGRAP